MRLYRLFLFVLLVHGLLAFFSIGFSRDLVALMPDQSLTGPWSPNGNIRIYSGDRLYDYMNGGAEVYYEYGFIQVAVQEYINGSQSMVLEIYQMQNSDGAYGIYTFNRDESKPAINIGDDGTLYDYSISFWQDCYYVNVMAYTANNSGLDDLKKIAQSISDKIATRGSLPELISFLPDMYLNPRSICYVMGKLGLNSYYYVSAENVFELAMKGTQGVWGAYSQNDSRCSLFLAHYTSAAEANLVRSRLENVLIEKFRVIAPAGPYTTASDAQGRSYLCGAGKNFVALVVKCNDTAFAIEILNQIFFR